MNHQQGDVSRPVLPEATDQNNFRNNPVEVWSNLLETLLLQDVQFMHLIQYQMLQNRKPLQTIFNVMVLSEFDVIYGLMVIYTGLLTLYLATDHTAMKAPVLVRSLKLTMARLG